MVVQITKSSPFLDTNKTNYYPRRSIGKSLLLHCSMLSALVLLLALQRSMCEQHDTVLGQVQFSTDDFNE